MERTKFPNLGISIPVLETNAYKINGKYVIKTTILDRKNNHKISTESEVFLEEEDNTAYVHAHVHTRAKVKRIKEKVRVVERNAICLPLAQRLMEIIITKKKIKSDLRKLKSWAIDIGKTMDEYSANYEEIKHVLDWYSKNIGGRYIPVVLSGSSFRSKYLNLLNAMERTKLPDEKHPPVYDDGMRYDYNEKDGMYYHHRTGKLYIP